MTIKAYKTLSSKKSLATSILVASIGLAGCQPPAEITYPPIISATEGESVVVRGTTENPDNTSALSVNGISATSNDGWATWEATVQLDMGVNKLTVSTTDTEGKINSSAASVEIERVDTFLVDAANSALDRDNNRMLLVDDAIDAVIAVDLTTGDQNILSGPGIPDSINPLSRPISIAIDNANNRALVLDNQNSAVIAIDLSSGSRTVLSNASIPNGDNRLITSADIVVDASNNRALVSDIGSTAIVAVDLTTGVRTVFSNNSTPNSTNPFGRIESIALDEGRDRLLVVDHNNREIVAVSLSSGERTSYSSFNGSTTETSVSYPDGIAIDAANDRALVIDRTPRSVIAMDLTTGDHSLLHASGTTGVFTYMRDIIIDADNNRALIPDSVVDAVVAMNLTTNETDFLSNSLLGFDTSFGAFFGGVALDKANNRLLVADDGSNSIIAVDRKTGKRTTFSDNSNLAPNSDKYLAVVSSIIMDEPNQRALILERSASRTSVQSVNLTTGERTILSNNSIPNSDNPFENLEDIALDSANNRALVVVSDQPAIYSVDLTSGARSILSNNSTPNANSPFGNIISGIAVDAENNRAFVTDETNDSVVEVNLTNGERTLFWEFSTPTIYERPAGIQLDSVNNRLLIAVPGIDALMALDIETKAQSFVSNSSLPDASNVLDTPDKFTIDADNKQVYLMDHELGLIVIDMATGTRVVMSR